MSAVGYGLQPPRNLDPNGRVQVQISSLAARVAALERSVKQLSDPPRFSAYRNGTAPNFYTHNAYTTVLYDSESYDTHNWYNPANGRFTPQQPGIYYLTASSACPNTGALASWYLVLFKNNAEHRAFHVDVVPAGAFWLANGSAEVVANGTTDYFDVRVWQNTGAAKDLYGGGGGYVYFQGRRVV